MLIFICAEKTNLKMSQPHYLPLLLQQILKGVENLTAFNPPNDWSHDWSQKLWLYLKQHCANNLSQFEELSILPANENTFMKLSRSKPALLASRRNIYDILPSLQLAEDVQLIVRKLGVTLISSLPEYVEQHQCLLDNYVMLPDVGGVLNSLVAMAQLEFPSNTWHNWQQHVFEKLSILEKRTFRKYISSVANAQSQSNYKNDWPNLCRHLQLFELDEEIENSAVKFTSIAMCLKMAAKERIVSLPLLINLLDASDASAVTLAGWFGIYPMSAEELLVEVIFQNVTSKCYSKSQLETLIEAIIPSYLNKMYRRKPISQYLCSLQFIPTNLGNVKSPTELYDSSDDLLCKLLEGQDVFPSDNVQSLLPHLLKLGLKTRKNVTDVELVFVAKDLHQRPSVEKSEALLCFIKATISDATRFELSRLNWLTVAWERPKIYPNSLPWAGEQVRFSSPNKITHGANADICGSVCIFPKDHPNVNSIFDILDGRKEPDVLRCIDHLHHIVENYNSSEKFQYIPIVIKLYEKLQRLSAGEYLCLNAKKYMRKWVWHGDGFCEASRCFIDKVVRDMSPHAYCLPEELKNFVEFFRSCGVRDNVDKMDLLSWVAKWYAVEDNTEISAEYLHRDTELVIKILNEVRDDIKSNKLKLNEISSLIFIPVETESQYLRLVKPANCTYYDGEWQNLQKNFVEYKDLQIIHHDIPIATAQCLGIPSLTSKLISAEELEFESYGQSEPLTTRIKNLIKDYNDGLSVLKEFVQNADDARATEVHFLFDERENLDARTLLVDKEFSKCQGAAIVVYNDAVFSDDDFRNIVKLGGTTKEKNAQKIGQFGLGFNSVYNITDVPCFLSRNNLAIFDPHMKYISNICKNKSNPGVKISLDTLMKHTTVCGDQIKPFQHLFGCNINESNNSFQGTIFRLPLRTPEDAIESEICQKHYSRNDVYELFKLLFENGQNILLFTQNVKKIKLHHLSKTDESSTQMKLLYKVTKTGLNKLQYGLTTCCDEDFQFLKQAAEAMTKETNGFLSLGLNVSLITELISVLTLDGNMLLLGKGKEVKNTSNWLINQSVGKKESFSMAKSEAKLLPVAGVAIKLIKCGKDYRPVCLVPTSEDPGLLFCFLPLPEQSYLPVHVNGCFALSLNRQHLMTANNKDKEDPRAQWNHALFVDAVIEAYINAVVDLRLIVGTHVNDIFSLWPIAEQNNKHFIALMTDEFYERVVLSEIQLFPHQNDWKAFENCEMLDGNFRFSPAGEIAQKVLLELSKRNYCSAIFELPKAQWFHLQALVQEKRKEKVISPIRFFEEYFLPNIKHLDRALVDCLLMYALFSKDFSFSECLKHFECIPVKPYGKFKHFVDLVHPNGRVAPLFKEEEECFPIWSEHNSTELCKFYQRMYNQHVSVKKFCQSLYDALVELGMKADDLPINQLREKAVATKNCLSNLRPYCNAILLILEKKVNEKSLSTDDIAHFKMVPFLPVKMKPRKCFLKWSGDNYNSTLIARASSLYLEESTSLICCIAPIVDESQVIISATIRTFLDFKEKQSIDFHLLLQQLTAINDSITNYKQTSAADSFDFVRNTCFDIYKSLSQNNEPESELELFNNFNSVPFIFLGNQLVKPSLCSFTLDFICDPYLYGLRSEPSYLGIYKHLMSCVGVKDTFNSAEYNRCLQCMYEKFGCNKLGENDLQKAINISFKLVQALDKEEKNVEQLQNKHGPVYLPDESGILRKSSDLVYNEMPWLSNRHVGKNFICAKLGYGILKQLGGRTLREEIIHQHMFPFVRPFGQKEKLTRRLKKIISVYPKDESILRELLQNADDAGCTEIHFILDPRNHKAEKVFSEEWKQLQGPSLLVLNDKCFSDEDLQGIQNLGEGGKGNDSLKTGRFGVGFNCVYHLTDCPSLLTSTPSTGPILCIFDPHRKFIPHATLDNPGCLLNDTDKLEALFPDAMSCYTDKFLPKQATIFRFPLRTKYQSQTSSLSTDAVEPDDVKSTFDKFKNDAENCLLFLRHVTTIKISIVDASQSVLNTFFVQSSLHSEDLMKRNKFNEKICLYSKKVKHSPQHLLEKFSNNINSYELSITNSNNESGQWLIVQQFGLSKAVPVSSEVVSAIDKNDICMLLQGGVAFKLPPNNITEFVKADEKKRIYCFLPLPLTTHLPVHINGFFALDNEARRDLFRDGENSISSYRSQWNLILMEHVIAPAFVEMLVLVKAKLISCNLANPSRDFVRKALQTYIALFPAFDDKADVYTHILVKAVYQWMANDYYKLFPTLRSRPNSELIDVSWLPPLSDTAEMIPIFDKFHQQAIEENSEEIKPVLDTLQSKTILRINNVEKKPCINILQSKENKVREILLNCGMNVVEFPENIYCTCKKIFKNNFIEISPSIINHFFKSNGKFFAQSIMPTLPRLLDETPLKITENVVEVLSYFFNTDHSLPDMNGIQLLVTADGFLRCYSSQKPVFVSYDLDLVPKKKELFVHKDLFETLWSKMLYKQSSLKNFELENLIELLPEHLVNYRINEDVLMEKKDDVINWIAQVWAFIGKCLNTQKGDARQYFMYHARNLCIFPALNKSKQSIFYPVGKAKAVIDLTYGDTRNRKVKEALDELGICEPDYSICKKNLFFRVREYADETISMLAGKIDNRENVIYALRNLLENMKSLPSLDPEQYDLLLNYFATSLSEINYDYIQTLRRLPWYETVFNDRSDLCAETVYIICDDNHKIPRMKRENFNFSHNITFLNRNIKLNALYKLLGCKEITLVEFYINHLLPVLETATNHGENYECLCEERQEHLTFIRNIYKTLPIFSQHSIKFYFQTKRPKLFPNLAKELKAASELMDPTNGMLKFFYNEEANFLAEPYNSLEWRDFLIMAGLKHKISLSDFSACAGLLFYL